jgi:guanylate kinase
VANENLDRALEELASIVRAERCRTERRMELVERLE